MTKVIVIQQPMKRAGNGERPAFDFTAAKMYGEISILAPNGKQILTPDIFWDYLEDNLAAIRYNPRQDYIIPAGDYSVIFMVGLIIGKKYGAAKILRWVPGAAAYQPLQLNMA